MVCPFCASETKIYNSRGTHGKTQTWRRHRCKQCQASFTTREKIDWNGSVSVRASSQTDIQTETTPYSRERLFISLLKASENLILAPSTLSDLCDTIEYQLQKDGFFNGQTQGTTQITTTVTSVLHRFDANLALQYVNNVYRHQPPQELVKRLLEPPATAEL